ncbi:hypothetical protein HDU91_005244 [Kappamyces sp. JEL0680]|nr:hypothetical protein HDU91_005244 [Kappamyces sp. JEL0680]
MDDPFVEPALPALAEALKTQLSSKWAYIDPGPTIEVSALQKSNRVNTQRYKNGTIAAQSLVLSSHSLQGNYREIEQAMGKLADLEAQVGRLERVLEEMEAYSLEILGSI